MDDITSVDVLNVTNERYNTQDEEVIYNLLQQNTIDSEREDILKTWKGKTDEFAEKYNKIVDEMCDTYRSIIYTIKYADNLKVPFCWEYARISFVDEVNNLLNEFLEVDMQFSTFDDEIDTHRILSIQRGDNKLSESSITYLNTVFECYAHKSSCLKDDIAFLIKQGQAAFIESQQISTTCGNDMF